MNHLTEEQLILHYYGEEGEDPRRWSSTWKSAANAADFYGSLQRVLNVVDSLPVPERGAEYGAQVWKRIERRIPARRRSAGCPAGRRGAGPRRARRSPALLVAAFLAGRFYPALPVSGGRSCAASRIADSQAGERVLLVAVGDYLERSQMVLIELANANPKGPLDISSRAGARRRPGHRNPPLPADRGAYRRYAHRRRARRTGTRAAGNHARAIATSLPQELEKLRQRLEAEGILFKIRVLGSNVRNQDVPAAQTAGQTLKKENRT